MSSKRNVPTVGITMGDAAGIGPEVVLKAVADAALIDRCKLVIIGDGAHLRLVADRFDLLPNLDDISIADLANLPADIEYGIDSPITGRASAEYIENAVDLWRRGEINAIATAPISKKAIALGGYDFPGHTEFLAALTDTTDFRMSFFAGELRVVLLSTHMPLVAALTRVRQTELVDLIKFADRELGKLLNKRPRIAVAGLNPHASEDGLFGSEEAQEISPAIEHCREHGLDVSGPYSPDTIFLRCAKGEFDACIALYHDQATIPVKSLAFNSAVNVTLGLPVIRTSVDHGTAFEIAGKGVANAESMVAAIGLAAELARSK